MTSEQLEMVPIGFSVPLDPTGTLSGYTSCTTSQKQDVDILQWRLQRGI